MCLAVGFEKEKGNEDDDGDDNDNNDDDDIMVVMLLLLMLCYLLPAQLSATERKLSKVRCKVNFVFPVGLIVCLCRSLFIS